MSVTELSSYREVASTLTPSAVSQFLAAHDWELETRQAQIREIWRLTSSSGALEGRIMVPLATAYTDFQQRFEETLESLGYIHNWDAQELHEHIIGTHADLFFVRLDQTMTDGTIPFHQAEKTIQALYKMMRAAATTAASPSHPHRGRLPSGVSDFLDEDVRLGHTKSGSFVFTIVTRLGESPPSTNAEVGVEPADSLQRFPRRVMETLARGLETTERLSRQWDERVIDAPGSQGVSASLIESLEDIAAPHLRSVDLSFEWAAAVPRPDVGLATIVLDRDVMAELPRVRERLVRQEEPPRQGTLVGLVKTLSRDEASTDDEETASVVLTADVHGKLRRVHMTLSGEDHNWAVIAYQRKLPFTVTGMLGFERRAWHLTGDLVVDSSFLRHATRSQSGPEDSS
ncbi:hypothetical protein ACOT81_39775 [Streptomyces sp. WI04-05B]|uniref:hypothetical protein n=1 Tax=Streptomyces TaxID=1883 RepID=UPI0005CB019F|nr:MULTISPECIES: hypothetical protein [Streptomyces]MDX2548551.1 hypothetical protein [Streptomyces sp. WI04-05B]MDX2582589.1 hypothetical protein [Streptomyces sp. WI04-05A]MDX3499728.1 hypothetical protein [Streptomyces turgidiscabies]GAQ77316.1 hypothetical protein T45_09134 [Streptomyces turgidiscabies]